MAELAENPAESPQLPPERAGKWVHVFVAGFLAFFLVIGIFALWVAFHLGEAWNIRIAMLLAAGTTFAFPIWAVWVAVRRKRKTGQWKISDEERRQWAIKNAKKPAWLRFVPPWLRNEPNDPQGIKLTLATCLTPIAIGFVIQAYRHRGDGFRLFMAAWWVITAAFSIWGLYRKPWNTKNSESRPRS